MHFKNPEILYFLFLLIIPIIVHLFQLRKFKTQYFSNVKFLKELSIQTRKSSKIKKWLLLVTRLALLACIILAFAQPVFKSSNSFGKNNDLIILLDNSFSMQAQGKKGELLKRSVQELLENVPEEKTFTLITPDQSFYDTDIRSIQRDLQNLNFSANPFSLENELAKTKTIRPQLNKDIIVITDGNSLKEDDLKAFDKNHNIIFDLKSVENKNNVSVDSVYISGILDEFYEIKVKITSYGDKEKTTPVSIYNQQELVAKTLLDKDNNKLLFTIPKADFNGFIQIEDNSLSYDNTYYFSISKPEKTKIIAIGTSSKNEFLTKIYNPENFDLVTTELNTLDYNSIEYQNTIILNEIEEYSQSLITTLKAFVENGGNLIVIPSEKLAISSTNNLLSQFGNISVSEIEKQKKMITKIAFDHPVFKNVFEKKTENFQYPSTNSSFNLNGNVLSILSYQDNSNFLSEVKKQLSSVYLFSAPINKENSNFLNSPLVVLSFYNMAQNHNNSGITSWFISDSKPFYVDAHLEKEELLTVKNQESEFIPAQQIFNRKVQLNFYENPTFSGNYGIYKKQELITNIGFNYPRTESDVTINNSSLIGDFSQKNIEQIFTDLHAENSESNFWKWLLLLGLLFLLIEILIQKFIK